MADRRGGGWRHVAGKLAEVREQRAAIGKGIVRSRALLVAYRHRGLRPEDVAVVSFPKSGSTWLRFLVVQAATGKAVDFDGVKRACPPVGQHGEAPMLFGEAGRFVKSHEAPRSVTAGVAKVLYLVRDGRDVAVSLYYQRARRGKQETFSGFLDTFLDGRANNYGSWKEHVRRGMEWAAANPHSLLVRYEDLLENPEMELRRVLDFCGLVDRPWDVGSVVADNTASRMRSKEGTSERLRETTDKTVPFVRKADSGDWRSHFSDEDIAKFTKYAGAELRELGYEG